MAASACDRKAPGDVEETTADIDHGRDTAPRAAYAPGRIALDWQPSVRPELAHQTPVPGRVGRLIPGLALDLVRQVCPGCLYDLVFVDWGAFVQWSNPLDSTPWCYDCMAVRRLYFSNEARP